MEMMKCGHSANGTNEAGKPVCVICVGLTKDAEIVAETVPDLTGRIARCSYGGHKDVPSSTKLPFFKHNPNGKFDSYYCGCYGWN